MCNFAGGVIFCGKKIGVAIFADRGKNEKIAKILEPKVFRAT